jgi:hypothetical protein
MLLLSLLSCVLPNKPIWDQGAGRAGAHPSVARWSPGRATGTTTLRAALRAVLGRGPVARPASPAGAPPQPTRLMSGWLRRTAPGYLDQPGRRDDSRSNVLAGRSRLDVGQDPVATPRWVRGRLSPPRRGTTGRRGPAGFSGIMRPDRICAQTWGLHRSRLRNVSLVGSCLSRAPAPETSTPRSGGRREPCREDQRYPCFPPPRRAPGRDRHGRVSAQVSGYRPAR